MKTPLRSLILILIVIVPMAFLQLRTDASDTEFHFQPTLEESVSSLDDAEIYAKHHGISVDEAVQRFYLQEVAGDLGAKLTANEAETFAGLWIEHSPNFQIIVQFTQDADQTIEPYITEELSHVLDVRTASVTLVELERMQSELMPSLTNLQIRFELEVNVLENNIELGIGEADKPSFDLALQNGLLQLPDYVIIHTIPEVGKLEASLGDHFPQLINPPNAYYDLPLMEGELALEDGCLRVIGVENFLPGESFLLIWDTRFTTHTEQGVVQVIDSNTGEVLASVGDQIAISYNGDNVGPTKKPIPYECSGPYWVVGQSIKKINVP